MLNPTKCSVAVCLGVVALAQAATGAIIDNFNAGSLVFVPGSTTNDVQITGAMLGGERDETVTNSSAGGGILAGANGGAFSYGALNATGSALLVWDGNDGDPAIDATGLGGIDLTELGTQTDFSIEILSNDFIAPLVLTVYTNAGDFSQITISTPGGMPSGPAQTIMVPFVDLLPTGAGADFTNVGAITLEVDGSLEPQLDLTIGSFGTAAIVVPEPATAAQLGLGLIGLAIGRRRVRR